MTTTPVITSAAGAAGTAGTLTASIVAWCAMPLIAHEFCLKPGEVHPGPCKGPASKIKRAVRKVAAKKAIGAPPRPIPAHQRAQGRDLLAELDMNRIGPLPKNDSVGADQQLAAIAHAQGFDGLPAVGTARELDALKDDYGIEVWRGVKHGRTASAEEIAEQFRSGPIHYGQGISGNGTYTGSNRDVALRYTSNHDGDGMTRMVIHPDAQIIELGELRDMMDAEIPDDVRARIKALGAFTRNEVFIPGGRPQDTVARAMRAPREMLQPQDWVWMDPSAYAMAKGFDVVKQQYGRHDEYVILNRTAVTAQQADRLPRTLRDFYPEDYLEAAGYDLGQKVALCLPPHTPVPKPGPCPGAKRALVKSVKKASKPIRKTAAAPRTRSRDPAHPQSSVPSGALASPVTGRDLSADLDFAALRDLPLAVFGADRRLGEIARQQGFDGPPQVVSAEQMDKLIGDGNRELWRGVIANGSRSAAQINQQLRSGPAHYGRGVYGNGIYFSPHRTTAEIYSRKRPSGLTRAVLHPDARTISWNELKQRVAATDTAMTQRDTSQRALLARLAAATPQEYQKTWDEYVRDSASLEDADAIRDLILANTSNYAMAHGFDAITLTEPATSRSTTPEDQVIVLNRTALVVEDPLPAGRGGTSRDASPKQQGNVSAAGEAVKALIASLTVGIEGCRPPHVPVPKPGPCPGTRRGIKKAVAGIRKTRRSRLDVGARLNYRDLVRKMETGGNGDQAMAEIAHRQGFDAEPLKGTQSDLDKALADGGIEMWRTQLPYGNTSADEMTDRFFNGPADYGFGLWGSGWNATTDAALFDNTPHPLLRMVIPRSAIVIDLDDLVRRQRTQQRTAVAQQRKLFAVLDNANGSTAREKALRALQDWTARQPDRDRVLRDPGRFAAALGHDAIRIRRPGQMDHYVILNRGNVWVEQKQASRALPRALQPAVSRTAGAAFDECLDERDIDDDTDGSGDGVDGELAGRRRKKRRPKPQVAYGSTGAGAGSGATEVMALLVRETAIRACLPPHVPVPKPGPCKGAKRSGVGDAMKKAARATSRAVRRATADDITPARATGGPGIGRDLTGELNMGAIARLPRFDDTYSDQRLAHVAARQGFDALPQTASDDALERAVAQGGRRLYRGVIADPDHDLSVAQLHDQFTDGPVRFGQGLYGNGVYFSDQQRVGLRYANMDERGVQTVVLPVTARTITFPDLIMQMGRDPSTTDFDHERKQSKLLAGLARASDINDMLKAWETYQGASMGSIPQADPGLWAMAHGYDAVIVPVKNDETEVVLLNRGAVLTRTRPTDPRTLAASAVSGGSAGFDDAAVRACLPPHVPVPKPGPCPGTGRAVKKAVRTVAKTGATKKSRAVAPTPKPVIKTPPVPSVPQPSGGPGIGRDMSDLLDSESIASLPMYDSIFNDQRLVAIAKAQGFDAPARVVDSAEADEAFLEGGRELWRGVGAAEGLNADQLHQRTNSGPLYFGQGQFGNGTYYSDDRRRAAQFGDASAGAVQRAVLPATARVISYPDLLRAMGNSFSDESAAYQAKGRTLLDQLAAGRSAQDFRQAWNHYKYTPPAHLSSTDSLKTDPGAWAMAHGYDAYTVPGAGSKHGAAEIVILNRSALLIDSARQDSTRPPVTPEFAVQAPARVQACLPPHVPVPKPGPCKGIKQGAKATVKKLAEPVSRGRPRRGPGGGRNLARLLNMDTIAQLPRRSTVGNDERLAAIAREQGFDAPARVVDGAALDKAVRDGGRELWRGVRTNKDLGLSPQDVHDRAATGPVHYGRGIFGNGIYFSDAAGVAATYGDNLFFPQESVRRSVLDPRARTITYGELAEKMARDKSTSSAKHQQRAKKLLESLARARDTADMKMAVETWQGSPYSMSAEDSLRTDPGAWAMSRGYDAIIVPLHNANPNDRDDLDQNEIVVLNRGALLTEKRPPALEPEPVVEQQPAESTSSRVRAVGTDLTGDLDFDQISALPRPDKSSGDQRLGAIAARQGFDGLPRLGTAQDLDRAKSGGGVELFRAIVPSLGGRSPEDMIEQFANGPAWFGIGKYGNGLYAIGSLARANEYRGKNGKLMRMVLDPDAHTITYAEALRQSAKASGRQVFNQQQELKKLSDRSVKINADKRAGKISADERDRLGNEALRDYNDAMTGDYGSGREHVLGQVSNWAAANGYDAVIAPEDLAKPNGRKEYVLLNRSAVLLEHPS